MSTGLQKAHDALIVDSIRQGMQSFVLKSYLNAVNGVPGAGQFRSDITNWSKCVDMSQDLKARIGINHVMTHQITSLPGEFGPNGEQVSKPVNDDMDQFRFVGGWSNLIDSSGVRPN